jgi:hypothetical protein
VFLIDNDKYTGVSIRVELLPAFKFTGKMVKIDHENIFILTLN